jgi:hypothetical protein
MEKVDYDDRLHAVYAAGRQMSPDALQTWMEAFARHLPETRPLVWLDLGSGTVAHWKPHRKLLGVLRLAGCPVFLTAGRSGFGVGA